MSSLDNKSGSTDEDLDFRLAAVRKQRENEKNGKGSLRGKAIVVADVVKQQQQRATEKVTAWRKTADAVGRRLRPLGKAIKWVFWDNLNWPLSKTINPLLHVTMPNLYEKGKVHWHTKPFTIDGDNKKHFNWSYIPHSVTKAAIVYSFTWPLAKLLAGAFYYYGTWALPMSMHKDIFFPSTNRFQSQQFQQIGQTGNIMAPRDLINSVEGGYIKDGKFYPQYYEIDSNGYFGELNSFPWISPLSWINPFYGRFPNATNPKYIGPLLNSQSSAGLKCDLETTGLYVPPFSRFFRFRIVQWLDLVPEIVKVNKCVELQQLPEEFKHIIREGKLERPAQPVWSGQGFYGKPQIAFRPA